MQTPFGSSTFSYQLNPHSGEKGTFGKLEKTIYGTLDAAERWGGYYVNTLTAARLTRGTASPCHFYHPAKDIWILVHGHEFVVVVRQGGRAYAEKHSELSMRLKSISPAQMPNILKKEHIGANRYPHRTWPGL